jgi:hypothetical protein
MRPPDGNIAEARLIVLDNALDCPVLGELLIIT